MKCYYASYVLCVKRFKSLEDVVGNHEVATLNIIKPLQLMACLRNLGPPWATFFS